MELEAMDFDDGQEHRVDLKISQLRDSLTDMLYYKLYLDQSNFNSRKEYEREEIRENLFPQKITSTNFFAGHLNW